MNITLSTKIKDIKLSKKISRVWNEKIVARYNESYGSNGFSERNQPNLWNDLGDISLSDLISYINEFYVAEYYNIDKYIEYNYVAIDFLNALKEEKLDVRNILEESIKNPPSLLSNKGLLDVYIKFLNSNNEFISESLLTSILEKLNDEKRYIRNGDLEEQINFFFDLLKVVPHSIKTEQWTIDTLDSFCFLRDDETRELVNASKNLRYISQNHVLDYIQTNFPQNIEKYKKYYHDLLDDNAFELENLYQAKVSINLYSLLQQYQLEIDLSDKLSDIAHQCLKVVASKEFMVLINKNIDVSNIIAHKTKSHISLGFSTQTADELKEFEDIFLLAVKNILKVQEKVSIEWYESYHSSENELSTNMDAKFIYQYYSYSKLNANLEDNNKGMRKNKI